MDEKHQMLELYKEFMYTKENFVSRSFATNKFYIIITTLCLLTIAVMKEFLQTNASISVVAVSLAGFAFAFLLWANQDAYSYLLKIKFSKVIDEMEKSFCFQPCVAEKEALKADAKNRRNFMFTDVQKIFALVAMAIFIASFFWDLIPIIYNSWFK